MKIYYFLVIFVGIMILFNIAGIETTSNQIFSYVGGDNPENWSTSGFLIRIAILLGAAALLAGVKISVLGSGISVTTEGIFALFIEVVYVIFAADIFSILTKIKTLTCPASGLLSACSWEYSVALLIIVPLMVGYFIASIEFIRGSD